MNASELVRIRTGDRFDPVVLCIPFAGGSAQSYFSWKEFFGPGVSLYAMELPGRGRCHSQLWPEQVQDLAVRLAKRLRVENVSPDIIFGHSFGALIAFELMREMRRNRSALPHTAVLSGRIAAMNPVTFGLPELSSTQLVEYLRDLGGTPDAILQNEPMLEMAIPILRGDLDMIKRYEFRPESPLDIDLVLLGGLEDKRVPIEGLMGWRAEFSGSFNLCMFPGGHFFIDKQRQSVSALLHELTSALLPAEPGCTDVNA